MKASKQQGLLPFCFGCDAEGSVEELWIKKNVKVEQHFRNEVFHVPMEVFVCAKCGFKLAREGDADVLVRATAEMYRKKHHLLSSAEMIARRKKAGLSQEAFAKRLGVGVASIKRWETGSVQDKSKDHLIRRVTNPVEERRLESIVRLFIDNHILGRAASELPDGNPYTIDITKIDRGNRRKKPRYNEVVKSRLIDLRAPLLEKTRGWHEITGVVIAADDFPHHELNRREIASSPLRLTESEMLDPSAEWNLTMENECYAISDPA